MTCRRKAWYKLQDSRASLSASRRRQVVVIEVTSTIGRKQPSKLAKLFNCCFLPVSRCTVSSSFAIQIAMRKLHKVECGIIAIECRINYRINVSYRNDLILHLKIDTANFVRHKRRPSSVRGPTRIAHVRASYWSHMRSGRGRPSPRWNGAAFESSTAVFTNSKEAGRGRKGEGGMKQGAKAPCQVYGLRTAVYCPFL